MKCIKCAGGSDTNYYAIKCNNKEIKVDKCIGKEVEDLIKKGVLTYGCCCGHGDEKPNCLVDLRSKSILNRLGYTLEEYSNLQTQQGIFKITLKTKFKGE